MTVFLILFIACLVGAIAIQPYQQTLLKGQLETARKLRPEKKIPSPAVLTLLGLVQSVIIFGLAAFFGVRLAPRVGLGWPVLNNWLLGTPLPHSAATLISLGLFGGIAAGCLILVLDHWFKGKLQAKQEVILPSRLQGFFASFYGGVAEEVLVRLFLMSLVVWLVGFTGFTGPGAYWLGIVIAALVFGLLHMPAASGIFGTSFMVWVRTILLNGVGGIVFGWLFWHYGLETAIIAHFTADLILHVIVGPKLTQKHS